LDDVADLLSLRVLPLFPGDLAPPYWINMGAMAISTLAGSLLILNAPQAPYLMSLLPFLKASRCSTGRRAPVGFPCCCSWTGATASSTFRSATIRSIGARCFRSDVRGLHLADDRAMEFGFLSTLPRVSSTSP